MFANCIHLEKRLDLVKYQVQFYEGTLNLTHIICNDNYLVVTNFLPERNQ